MKAKPKVVSELSIFKPDPHPPLQLSLSDPTLWYRMEQGPFPELPAVKEVAHIPCCSSGGSGAVDDGIRKGASGLVRNSFLKQGQGWWGNRAARLLRPCGGDSDGTCWTGLSASDTSPLFFNMSLHAFISISSNGSRDEAGRDLCPGSRNAPWAERCAARGKNACVSSLGFMRNSLRSHLISSHSMR